MAVNPAFEAQRRTVDDEFAARRAANDYSLTLSQQRGTRDLADHARSFGRAAPKFNASFAQRGLNGPGVRSGVFANSMQRYLGDYQRQRLQTQQGMTQESNQFMTQNASLAAQRQRALADIEAQQQAEIAAAALNIKAIQPYIG